MAENEDNSAGQTENGAVQDAPQIKMRVMTQFVRDLSFENILAQKGGGGDVQMDVSVKVNLDAKKRQTENHYEVAIKLTVDGKTKDAAEQLFILEMEYVGVFSIENVPEEQLHPFLLIECPRMLFPFLRRIVSDVTRDGGYPPLNLENIDFMQMYRTEIMRRQAEQQPEAKKPDA